MQREPSPVFFTHADAATASRPAADVPSDQLWRAAIEAARQAAAAAAELRRAVEAARRGDGRPTG